MGHARKKPEADPEDAKVLPAREALSLISSRFPDEDEEASGGDAEPVVEPDRTVEGSRRGPASTES
jgi:hypothetical protein